MLKIGLFGIGFMGRGHLDHYTRLANEGFPLQVAALCDIDEKKFKGEFVPGNLDMGQDRYDFSLYNLYTDIDEMLEKETFDYVDICLPTYLHPEVTVKALDRGLHVLCEKPMALNNADCIRMIEAAKRNDRKLMIGQCLRFWPHYVLLKDYIDSGRFGKLNSAYFFRGGHTPRWSYENWMVKKDKSGGCILDQHIHDVDLVNWLFGMPEAVSTLGRVVVPGSGYDVMSTNYIYPDGKVINAQGDWTLNGGNGFIMEYRVNFEQGNLMMIGGKVLVHPNGQPKFEAELDSGVGHFYEIKYFAECVLNDKPIEIATPESTMDTIRLAETEVASADRKGALVKVEGNGHLSLERY